MKKVSFNRNWEFKQLESEDQSPKESAVKTVNLPHDAMIEGKRSGDAMSKKAGAFFYGGDYQYTKRFRVPEEWDNKAVYIEFEGVYQDACIYVNGKLVKEHFYGYTGFFINLMPWLHFGKENEISVIARNHTPNSRWYSGAGIYRDVNLYFAEKEHICPEGILISTEKNKQVNVELHLADAIGKQAEIEICSPTGDTLQTRVKVKENILKESFQISDPILWSADDPKLYQCRVRLYGKDQLCDEETVSFGIRTLEYTRQGLSVNGQEVLLRGACVHHDSGILGACTYAAGEERKVALLKKAGFNAIRSAHNPMSKSMLDACDRMGMYVMDETFDQWLIHKNSFDYAGDVFRENWKADTKAMITKDYNHPSVIMYSIGNEISEICTEEGKKYCKEQVDFVHELDNSRPVTAGVNILLTKQAYQEANNAKKDKKENTPNEELNNNQNMPTSDTYNAMMNRIGTVMELMATGKKADEATKEAFALLDVAGYNYAAMRYQKDVKKYEDRIIVGTESLPKRLYVNWKKVESIPAVIGDFMWTGMDHLGEAGLGTIVYESMKNDKDLCISSGAGVIDICGKLRPEVGWNRIIWGLQKKPVIAVEPMTHAGEKRTGSMWRNTEAVESWSWEGCEGKKNDVIVYAQGQKVELVLNGKSLGTKKVQEQKAVFKNVSYEPGKIEAIVYDKTGNAAEHTFLESADGKTHIRVYADKNRIKADGQDLCFLDIELVGENNVIKSGSDQKLYVKVEGAGELAGFGSAKPYTSDTFRGGEYDTYYGRALAVVRSGTEAGNVRVIISGSGLETVVYEITAEFAGSMVYEGAD